MKRNLAQLAVLSTSLTNRMGTRVKRHACGKLRRASIGHSIPPSRCGIEGFKKSL